MLTFLVLFVVAAVLRIDETPPVLPKLYSVTEAAALLKISRWTLWRKLKDGQVRRTKVGGRTLIKEAELVKLIRDVE